MRRGLVVYAVVGALIAVAASAAVLASAGTTAPSTTSAASAAPAPSGTRAALELSRAARLAYWRDDRLWISDLDGSLRYAIATTDDVRRVSLTRWSSDGASIAYVERGVSLQIATIRSDKIVVPLPRELLTQAGGRSQIKDLRWSPSGDRLAATVLRTTDGGSDAYIVDLTAKDPAWTRLTSMEDLFIGDWISDQEILGYTAGGAVVAIDGASGQVRLLTGMTGVSPILGADGRIQFLAGRVPYSRDPSFAYQNAMGASVWSVTADGGDLRRETTWDQSDIRLDGRLPDGRYLVRRGSSNALGLVDQDVVLLPSSAGVIERLRIAPDGRTAYGFAPDKIVRLDLGQLPKGSLASAAPVGAASVFLDTSGEADVWTPSRITPARGTTAEQAGPAARYAFTLGGHLWEMERGAATLLQPGPPLRRLAGAVPRWSPTGDRLLTIEPTSRPGSYAATIIDRSGTATTLAPTIGVGASYVWSPSGSELAAAVDQRGQSGLFPGAQLEIRFLDPSGRQTRTPVAGSEVAWTTRGIYVIAESKDGRYVGRVDGEGPARPVATIKQLLTDARAAPQTEGGLLSGLDASPDGAYLTVRVRPQDSGGFRAYLVILDASGAAMEYIRADDMADAAWAPTGELLGYTLGIRGADERAVVVSPQGTTLAIQGGRFAGWSPDAKWYLVGQQGILYAYPVAGGGPVRLGPAGLPVSAAATR